MVERKEEGGRDLTVRQRMEGISDISRSEEGEARQTDRGVGIPLVSITDRSVSLARHSTETAASDTPLGVRV